MSSLSRAGGSTIGTPVDPASPSGILIDPYTEIGTSPALDEVIKGDGLGGWTVGLPPGGPPSGAATGDLSGNYPNPSVKTKRLLLEFSTTGGVPSSGVRYLSRGGVAVTSVPVLLPAAATLLGVTVGVNVIDSVQSYNIEVVSGPAPPTLIGLALALPASTLSASRRDLSGVIGAGALWGVRVIRTSGVAASVFTTLRVEVEVEMP